MSTETHRPLDALPGRALTPRERLVRALRGQRADRVPAWLMRQAGRYLPGYQALRRRYGFLALCKTPEAAAEVSIEPLEAIGSEAVIVFNDILVPLEHAGALVQFDDDGPLIANPVREAKDLIELATRPVTGSEPVAETIREVRRRVGDSIPILGFVGSPWTLAVYWVEGRMSRQFSGVGPLRWRDPGLLLDLMERLTPIVAEYLRVQIEAGADAVQIFDTWGSILGQAEYARFSAPFLRRVIEHVRPAGVPVIVYVNGCAPYLDQLGALGADAVSVDWRVDLACAREALGPGVALQGNLDPTALLAGPQAAERAVAELFENFHPGPGHVFNLGHGVLPTTAPEAARRVLDAVKRYGVYA